MEVLTVQNQYNDQHYNEISTTRIKNWSRSLSNNAQDPRHHHHHQQQQRRHAHQQKQQTQQQLRQQQIPPPPADYYYATEDEQQIDCDSIDAAAVNELSLLLLAELRAAKTRNLTCTEVSLPSDLTQRIATDIVRVSEREPCGIRGCTVFVEYEEELNSVKRIAKLKLDPEMVSTFEVYLTLRQDKRGWTSLLPQFIKGLSRTITISPDYTINKRKLYSHDSN
ncbi:protein scylla-like [Lucilia sericata]|uniref:protein scylla-like n=1 Tax=Lucilia sericata TaxID=13632 RepID=UPI0018A8729E|nr:protein scylla-like [Lucilia sericata]